MVYEVSFSSHGNDECLRYAEDTIKRLCGCDSIDWQEKRGNLKANIKASEMQLKEAFQAIVDKYEDVYLYASATFQVREDDYSADWWGSVAIQIEKVGGKKTVVIHSSTYWN